jgi:hypothetical protein
MQSVASKLLEASLAAETRSHWKLIHDSVAEFLAPFAVKPPRFCFESAERDRCSFTFRGYEFTARVSFVRKEFLLVRNLDRRIVCQAVSCSDMLGVLWIERQDEFVRKSLLWEALQLGLRDSYPSSSELHIAPSFDLASSTETSCEFKFKEHSFSLQADYSKNELICKDKRGEIFRSAISAKDVIDNWFHYKFKLSFSGFEVRLIDKKPVRVATWRYV